MLYENISVRVDKDTKRQFNSFCDSVGLNPSSAITMYIKKVLHDRKIPFEISDDPFFSTSNQERLSKSIAAADAGKLEKHNLIEM